MSFLELVKKRKSVRSFLTKPVEEDKLLYALECARLSPSWQNKQCWRFIIISDPETKQQLIKKTGFNTNKLWIKNAPVIVIGLAKPVESGKMNGMEYYLVDFGIAMEHFVLGAADVGLGTCWLGWFNEEKVRRFLNIPEDYKVVALTPLGYQAEKKNIIDVMSKKFAGSHKRKELKNILFSNYFGEDYVSKIDHAGSI
ncbi:nitroreductase family protein [Candidatus Dependentiae bacterium]|nr:nitroreductase family protein [Candidatus Dependentiae bacterium]